VTEPAAPAQDPAGADRPAADQRLDLAAIAARLAARQPAGDGGTQAPAEDAPEPAAPPADPSDGSDLSDQSDQSDRPGLAGAERRGEPPAAEGPEVVVAEPQLSGAEVFAAVEALLFAADRPLTAAQIARALPAGVGAREVRRQLGAVAEALADSERGYGLLEIAGGWQLLTREKYAPYVQRLRRAASAKKLSGSALETLAVVAYRQPVARAEIERIRGVNCGDMLRGLLDKRLVRIAGRSAQLGNALLYGTTQEFLEHFGLKSIADLPRSVELARKPAKPAAPGAEGAAPAGPPSDGSDVVEPEPPAEPAGP